MELTSAETQIKRIACFLGFIQGLAYAVMAVISIVLYNIPTPTVNPESYMETVNVYMYGMFLSSNRPVFTNQTMHPGVFTAFAWVYFILSVGWISVSSTLWFKKEAVLPTYLRFWSHFTVFISFWDFITVVIIGADYRKCLTYAANFTWLEQKIALEGMCANALLPVMLIAARGFVLWIVNIIFAYLLNNMAARLIKEAPRVQQHIEQDIPRPPAYPPQQSPYHHPSAYMRQSSQPGSAQFRPAIPHQNRSPFEYPAPIPEPDYYYQQQQQPQRPSSILRKY